MTGRCPRCGRELLEPAALAGQADRLRAKVEGAVQLAGAGPGLSESYGGQAGATRALRDHLDGTAALALEHSRALACLAGRCALPTANDPAEPG